MEVEVYVCVCARCRQILVCFSACAKKMDVVVERPGRPDAVVTVLRGPISTVGWLRGELHERLDIPVGDDLEMLRAGEVLIDDSVMLDDAGFALLRDTVLLRPAVREAAVAELAERSIESVNVASVDAALDAEDHHQLKVMLRATTHPARLLSDALFRACRDNNTGRAKTLVTTLGADVNTTTDDVKAIPALSYAAMHSAANVCLLLIDHKADVNRRDGQGRTPFVHAMNQGIEHVCVALLKHGAVDVRCRAYMQHAERAGMDDVVEEFAKVHSVRTKANANPYALEGY